MNLYSRLFYLCSVLMAVPSTGAVLARFLRPHMLEGHSSKVPESSRLDTFFRWSLAPYCVYYLLDTCALLYLYHRMDACNLAFLIHHVITLVGMPSLGNVPYYPWYLVAPVAFHNFLVWFPEQKWLNYIYLALILRMYWGLTRKPWIQHRLYVNSLIVAVSLLVLPIAMLWWFDCANDMENTSFDRL
jgi:hypothetical protein